MRMTLAALTFGLAFSSGLQAQEPAAGGSVASSFRSYIVVDNRTERFLIPKDKEIDQGKVMPFMPKLMGDVADDRRFAEAEIEKIVKSKDLVLKIKLESKVNPKNRAGKIHSVIEDQNLYPTLAVFVRSNPDPQSKVIDLIHKSRDTMGIPNYRAMNFGAFVIFLNLQKEFQDDEKRDDALRVVEDWVTVGFGKKPVGDASKVDPAGKDADKVKAEKLAIWNANKKLFEESKAITGGVVIGLGGKESEAAKNWNLGDDDITIVMYHRLKEVQRWKFKDSDFKDADVDAVIDAAKKEMDKR